MNSNLFKKLIKNSDLKGFTLLELVIFMAIFALISISFVAVLISILRVQNRETSLAEVNRQSQFVLTTIQRYIEESSLIETQVSDTATSTLILRMASSTDYSYSPNPPPLGTYTFSPSPAKTFIYLANNKIYLKEFQNGDPQALTSDRVVVDQLDFKKHANPGGHDSVDIVLALHYNSPNIQKRFAQLLQTSVGRINAATFDSNIMPSSTNLSIGSQGYPWNSINGIINFSNGNVGVGGVADANYKLSINGGVSALGNPSYFAGRVGINFDPNNPGPNGNGQQQLTVNGNIRLISGSIGTVSCSSDYIGTIALDYTSGNTRLIICTVKGGVYKWAYIVATTTQDTNMY